MNKIRKDKCTKINLKIEYIMRNLKILNYCLKIEVIRDST